QVAPGESLRGAEHAPRSSKRRPPERAARAADERHKRLTGSLQEYPGRSVRELVERGERGGEAALHIDPVIAIGGELGQALSFLVELSACDRQPKADHAAIKRDLAGHSVLRARRRDAPVQWPQWRAGV